MLQYIRSLQLPLYTRQIRETRKLNQVWNSVRPALYNKAVLQLQSAIYHLCYFI